MTEIQGVEADVALPGVSGRLWSSRRYLRLRPFDTSTPEGRSDERYRRIAWSTLLAGVGKVISMGTGVISVPLVIGYLSDDQYGMWLTMSSLVAVLGPLDLGIGLGLLTILSDADGRGDRETARRAVATSLTMLLTIAAVLLIVFAAAYAFIPWSRLFNVDTAAAASDAGPAAAVLVTSFALGLPLGIIGLIQLAHQSNYISSLWAIAGNLGSLAAIVAVIVLHASLPILVVALTGVGLLAALLNGAALFRYQRPWLRPHRGDVDRKLMRPLLRVGGLFMILQIAGLVGYQLDNFVIAQIMGARSVQEYAVPVKLFSLAPTLLSFALMPLWPAYRESLARGDWAWISRTLRRSLLLAAAINIPSAVFLTFAGPMVLHLWVGDKVHPTFVLMLGLGLWLAMNTLNGPLAMLLNGANAMGFQAACAILMAVANVTISIFLVYRVGVSGAVWGSIIAQAVFVVLPSIWYVPRLLRRLRETPPSPA
jgi:Membrane protein involved in the export of O-antigen and teichoic acid